MSMDGCPRRPQRLIRRAPEAAAAAASQGCRAAGVDERFLQKAAGRVADRRPETAARGIARVTPGLSGNPARATEDIGGD